MTANPPLASREQYFTRTGLLAACLSMFLLGCSGSAPPSAEPIAAVTEPAPPADGPGAAELLEKVRAAYSQAKSYTDNATVVFYAVLRSTGGEMETPFTRSSVAFERPNKLHITHDLNISSPQEENYEVVSDGVVIRSTASEVPEQIHEAIAPLELTTDNLIPEPALRREILQNAIENSLPQLALLLTEDEQSIFVGEDQSRVLADAELEGQNFRRIELNSPAGKRILWIDPVRFTLRRMEIPIDNQRQQLNARNLYSRISVWIDFEDVTLDSEIDSVSFTLAVPEGARRVRRFIPPPPAGPPEHFGRPVGQFVFRTLEGGSVTPKTLAGKVTVLDFWSTNCPPCKLQTPVLNEVYQHFVDNEKVAFWAVSTDSRVVANDVVEKTLRSWGGDMPIVRDLSSSGYNELNVRQTPTLLMVDQQGRLEVFQIGAHQAAQPVIEKIESLASGESIVAADRARHDQYVAKYEEALAAAAIEDSIVEIEISTPEIVPRRFPENLRLQQLWQTSNEQLNRPGDVLLAVDSTEDIRLLVLDDAQAIVELDRHGNSLGRHALPEHAERRGGFLRSWSNSSGEQWALASGVGWQQVYVFDSDWKPVLSFPDDRHSGIGDVLFDDLTGSDIPVLHVGYWGGLGVHGGSLDGRRLWANRRLNHVLQLGVGPKVAKKTASDANSQGLESHEVGQTVWCASTRGTLLQLRADGRPMLERYIAGQALMYFASQPEGEQHCGLAVGKVGEYTAVGFDSSNAVAWEYRLPTGEYVEQLPRLQSVQMPDGESAWLVVAADGSLHWLNLSGELVARFNYGEILTGVTMRTVGELSLLFVSTNDSLTAWQVESPPVPVVEQVESPAPNAAAEPAETQSSIAEGEPESSDSEDSAQSGTTESSDG